MLQASQLSYVQLFSTLGQPAVLQASELSCVQLFSTLGPPVVLQASQLSCVQLFSITHQMCCKCVVSLTVLI